MREQHFPRVHTVWSPRNEGKGRRLFSKRCETECIQPDCANPLRSCPDVRFGYFPRQSDYSDIRGRRCPTDTPMRGVGAVITERTQQDLTSYSATYVIYLSDL